MAVMVVLPIALLMQATIPWGRQRWWFGWTLVPNDVDDRDLCVVTARWRGRDGDIVALIVGMTTMLVNIWWISNFFSTPKD